MCNTRKSFASLLVSVCCTLGLLAMTAWAQGAGSHDQHQHEPQAGKPVGGQMGGDHQQDMQTIHALFAEHGKVARQVKKIANGVETLTESDDPKVQAQIKEHVAAMYQRLAKKQPIRMWDPLYAALFQYADKIKMELVTTSKGIKVIETSADEYVVKLIQAHADGVSEFVKVGMGSMHKEHPLPDAKPATREFLGKGDGVTTCPVTGEPVNKEIKFGFGGRTVYFCCESCRDAVKLNPEKYLPEYAPAKKTKQ